MKKRFIRHIAFLSPLWKSIKIKAFRFEVI